jgi:hypothetical protein
MAAHTTQKKEVEACTGVLAEQRGAGASASAACEKQQLAS